MVPATAVVTTVTAAIAAAVPTVIGPCLGARAQGCYPVPGRSEPLSIHRMISPPSIKNNDPTTS